jgi:hypothetical protein
MGAERTMTMRSIEPTLRSLTMASTAAAVTGLPIELNWQRTMDNTPHAPQIFTCVRW